MQRHPQELYNLGIGDISEPLSPFILEELAKAALELKEEKTLRGYGPSQGYLFLRELISRCDYPNLGISPDEIFITSGIKDGISTFQELFAVDVKVGLMDPTYPVYLDSNIIAGRSENITFLPCLEENGFEALPPSKKLGLIYLCSPNNPTGIAFSRKNLKLWIDYAKDSQAIILFDGAYEAFTAPGYPRSIYEISGAKETCVEFRSYSKSAGFTSLRCGYVTVPQALQAYNLPLIDLWKRRSDAKYGGTPYPIQKAAAATYSPEGQEFISSRIKNYKKRALNLKKSLTSSGFEVYGGKSSPYLWCRHQAFHSSWELFNTLLYQASTISIPGIGFGPHGEGFVRFSALQKEEIIKKAGNKLNLFQPRAFTCRP